MINEFSWREQFSRVVLRNPVSLDFCNAGSLTRQCAGKYITAIGHIIIIPSQTVFVLTPYCCVISKEAATTTFTLFGLTQSGYNLTTRTILHNNNVLDGQFDCNYSGETCSLLLYFFILPAIHCTCVIHVIHYALHSMYTITVI